MLLNAEAHQSAVISALIACGDEHLASRLARCQRERRCRTERWPWRCRSVGCWQCRRTVMRRWWRGFQLWLGDTDVSLVQIPIDGDLISITQRLRKGLRDVRDRIACHDPRWAEVAMAGFPDGDRALILIDHPSVTQAEVWSVFERRWPEVLVSDVGEIEPSSRMTVEDAILMAQRRRGIEPIRIVILAQTAAAPGRGDWHEPMPVLI